MRKWQLRRQEERPVEVTYLSAIRLKRWLCSLAWVMRWVQPPERPKENKTKQNCQQASASSKVKRDEKCLPHSEKVNRLPWQQPRWHVLAVSALKRLQGQHRVPR